MAKLTIATNAVAMRVEALGATAIQSLHGTGLCGIQFSEALQLAFKPPFRVQLLIKQMEFIGNKANDSWGSAPHPGRGFRTPAPISGYVPVY